VWVLVKPELNKKEYNAGLFEFSLLLNFCFVPLKNNILQGAK
jgi:hypothetical protein